MKTIADFHIHSKYSRATSKNMNLLDIAKFCEFKGLNLIGTGDLTHPKWLKELKESLKEVDGSGIYRLAHNENAPTRFIVSGEVCTVFNYEDRIRKVHHIIMTPSIEDAEHLANMLKNYGDLSTDGRPTLRMSAAHLVEIVLELSNYNIIYPAHAWTPWYGVFGSKSGFNSLSECYQEMSNKVFALETGLSSDPSMNWRLSELDELTLLSNSDSHSAWPWRVGREANVFELDRLAYNEIIDAIREKKEKRVKLTIETDPAYGKYHWSGHRKCNISMSAKESIIHNDTCPICRRNLTKGVEQRVEELADREPGYRPSEAIDFIRLLPLSEIIAYTRGVDQIAHPKIWQIYNALIKKFGNEYSVLLKGNKNEIAQISDVKIAEAIIKMRNGEMKVTPGYDGIYGKIKLSREDSSEQNIETRSRVSYLDEFME